jgi:hypothetical protein
MPALWLSISCYHGNTEAQTENGAEMTRRCPCPKSHCACCDSHDCDSHDMVEGEQYCAECVRWAKILLEARSNQGVRSNKPPRKRDE